MIKKSWHLGSNCLPDSILDHEKNNCDSPNTSGNSMFIIQKLSIMPDQKIMPIFFQ